MRAQKQERLVAVQLQKLDCQGKIVPGTKLWAGEYASLVAQMPPRPETDYEKPVACPSCGQRRPVERAERYCVPCCNIGHDYRLMGQLELLWSAEVQERLGYPEVAAQRRTIAATLPTETRP